MSTDTKAETLGTHSPMGEELKPCQCGGFLIEIWDLDMPVDADPNDHVKLVGTGCKRKTTRDFAPGHDAKLKSLLIRAGAHDRGVRHGDAVSTATMVADRYGFAHQVVAGIERAVAQAEARKAKTAEKAAKKAQAAAAKKEATDAAKAVVADKTAKKAAAAKPQPKTSTLTIKVGAHVYEGATVDNETQEATYTTKGGQTKTVPGEKWSIVVK